MSGHRHSSSVSDVPFAASAPPPTALLAVQNAAAGGGGSLSANSSPVLRRQASLFATKPLSASGTPKLLTVVQANAAAAAMAAATVAGAGGPATAATSSAGAGGAGTAAGTTATATAPGGSGQAGGALPVAPMRTIAIAHINPNDSYDASPHFRTQIEEVEASTGRFENAMKRISQLSKKALEAEKAAQKAQIELSEEMVNLINVDGNLSLESESSYVNALSALGHILTTTLKARDISIKRLDELIVQSSTNFLTVEMPALEEKKQAFIKASDDFESEISRYCGLTRKNVKLKESEVAHAVRQSRRVFQRAAIEYCEALNDVHSTKKQFFLEKILTLVSSLETYHKEVVRQYKNGSEEVQLDEVEKQLLQFRQQFYVEKRELISYRADLIEASYAKFEEHFMAPSPFSLTTLRREKSQSSSDADRISIDSRQSAAVATPGGGAEPAAANEPAESPSTTAVDQTAHPAAASATAPAQPTDESALFASVVARAGSMPLEPKAGYLFKRSSGARKQWNRRWFEINLINMRLDYFSPKDDDQPTVAVYLKDASLRPADVNEERRFVFQVISNAQQYYLQAENEADYYDWIQVIANACYYANKPVVTVDVAVGGHVTGSTDKPLPSIPGGRMITPSSSSSNLTQRSMPRSSTTASFEVDDAVSVKGDMSFVTEAILVKSGELQLREDKGTSAPDSSPKNFRTFGRKAISTLFDMTQTAIGNEAADSWKTIHLALSKDGRLSLFEFEKEKLHKSVFPGGSVRSRSANRSSGATKAITSIDLASLSRYSLQTVHESLTGRRNSFCVETAKVKFVFACTNVTERDDWLMALKKYLDIAKDKQAKLQSVMPALVGPRTMKTVHNLFIELSEARNVPSNYEVYVEFALDGQKIAISSTKPKSATPFWGEPFEFEDIPEPKDRLTITIKSAQWLSKDSEIGQFIVSSDNLLNSTVAKKNEAQWYTSVKSAAVVNPSNPDAPKSDPEIKLSIRFVTVYQLQREDYDELTEKLVALTPADLTELTKGAPNLEALALNTVKFFQSQHLALTMLTGLLEDEIKSTDVANTLFRANSLATKSMDQYMKLIGMPYLHETVGDAIRTICLSKFSCEVDPTRLPPDADVNKNWEKLQSYTETLWNNIARSIQSMPVELRTIFHRLQKAAISHFGATNPDTTVRYTSVSGFLFLRFFCPAVLTPKLFGIVPEHPNEQTRRTLTLIAKTLQVLANLGSFGIKELYMAPMNDYIMTQTDKMTDFIDSVASTDGPATSAPVPVDQAYELALLQQYISSNKDRLVKSNRESIKTIVKVAEKVDRTIDKYDKMDLASFLME